MRPSEKSSDKTINGVVVYALDAVIIGLRHVGFTKVLPISPT